MIYDFGTCAILDIILKIVHSFYNILAIFGRF